MKISTRLAVTFSVISSAIFIAFGVAVYLLSANHRVDEFQERLKQRVEVTEKIFLEKESFELDELEKVMEEFLHTLPEETEEVLEIVPNHQPVYNYNYPNHVKDKLATNNTVIFEEAEVQGRSKIFKIDGKDYLVIVTAVDHVGTEYLSFLKNLIIILVLIGVPLIFLAGFIATNRALLPITKKIDKANTIGASNLDQRLIVHNAGDELGKMAIAFNKLLDRLQASFEAQKSFIRNASHEIRNPLTAIIGEAEIATSKSRTIEEYQQSLTVILNGGETLNTTVNNLLQLSKVAASEDQIKYRLLHFDEFLSEAKESFDFINPLNQITLDVSGETGMYPFMGNKNLLKTAVINLLDNACKFSSNSKVEVFLAPQIDRLRLTIKDKGIGIEQADIEKIMRPFFRGNNAIKIKGSGIGLSLSHKIVELHQGTLEIQSQVEIGTEVHVELPLVVT